MCLMHVLEHLIHDYIRFLLYIPVYIILFKMKRWYIYQYQNEPRWITMM